MKIIGEENFLERKVKNTYRTAHLGKTVGCPSNSSGFRTNDVTPHKMRTELDRNANALLS